MKVLCEPAVSDLLEAKYPFDDEEHMFNLGAHPRLRAILRFLNRVYLAVNPVAFVREHLDGLGMTIGVGTIVDATVTTAPQSLKNQDQQRGPQMRSGTKGNLWYFGMKAHIGVDSETKLLHSVVETPGNVHDSRCIGELLHGNERQVWGDAAYMGRTEVNDPASLHRCPALQQSDVWLPQAAWRGPPRAV